MNTERFGVLEVRNTDDGGKSEWVVAICYSEEDAIKFAGRDLPRRPPGVSFYICRISITHEVVMPLPTVRAIEKEPDDEH